MISPDQALEKIGSHIFTLPSEKISVTQSVDRILAKEIIAQEDLPSFDNSAMDGYAVKVQDLSSASKSSPVGLEVRLVIRAGSRSREELRPGEAFKIMTGAALPPGANAVVMKEWTESKDGYVKIFRAPKVGENIRPQAEDVRRGQKLLKAGTLLRPYEVALLVAQGIQEVLVVRKPKVALLSTGDELVTLNHKCSPGKIRNSNGPALAALLSRWGVPALNLGIVPDDEKKITKRLKQALRQADVVLISGGVSVGDFDYTRRVLTKLGVQEIFWKVAIKPGKPLYFGVKEQNRSNHWVFGLPGNPVSLLVCAEEFVRTALEKLQGHQPKHPSYHLQGQAVNRYTKPHDRQQFLFCRVTEKEKRFEIKIIRPQGSAMLGMAAEANALAMAPIGIALIDIGDPLFFRWLK